MAAVKASAKKRHVASHFSHQGLRRSYVLPGAWRSSAASGEHNPVPEAVRRERRVKRFGMEDGNPKVTPLEVGLQLSKSGR